MGTIGPLCRTLTVLGLDDAGWTAQDVIDLLDRRNIQLGLYSLTSSSQRDPLALFAHQVRAALVHVDEPPRLRRGRAAAERVRARAARGADVARLAAEVADPEVQVRIAETKRGLREQLAATRTQARYRQLPKA